MKTIKLIELFPFHVKLFIDKPVYGIMALLVQHAGLNTTCSGFQITFGHFSLHGGIHMNNLTPVNNQA